MKANRCFLFLSLVAVLCARSPLPAQEADPGGLLKSADDVLKEVVRVRGLDFDAPLKKSLESRIEMAAYIRERVRKDYDWVDWDREGKMLQALGLAPDTVDYGDYAHKLLAEPLESRYDGDRNILYIASWISAEEQRSVLAHECARALQTRHFDIAKILDSDRAERNNDRGLAHQALLEGDRTIVMLQMALEADKRHFSELPNLAYVMQSWMATTRTQDAVSENAPEYLKQWMLFPYGYGASFLQEIWKHSPGWASINAIYDDPPVSTEQILHPEKYFGVRDNPKPVAPMDPIARLGNGWRTTYENVLGEFSLGQLLSLNLTEEYSRKAVSGWGGDSVEYLENDAGRNAVFVNTIWDTDEDAETFFSAMDGWFGKQFPKGKRSNETSNGFAIVYDGKFSEIRRNGRNLYFILGLPEAESRKWLGK